MVSEVGYLLFFLMQPINVQIAASNEALIEAAGCGDVDGVEAALVAGANINAVDANGNSALHRACHGGHEAVASALLDAGADPNFAGEDGMRPLHVACASGDAAIVAMLLAVGADVLATTITSGTTPRDLAVENGYQDCVDAIDGHTGEPGWPNALSAAVL